jgi:hypoxanthine phosphoribosyltransferase
VVGLLRGAFVFIADLVRQITVPHAVDFMFISSYEGAQGGSVCINKDMSIDPQGKHVLIVEDLIDTGNTLAWLCKHLTSKNALSVELCTLLDKQTKRRGHELKVKYVGLNCADEWIVGYGMDYQQHYRGLPFIGVLDPKVYQHELKEKKPS